MLKRFFDALRVGDRAAFVAVLEAGPTKELLRTQNVDRYENWFSGIGATLLQLTAFLRPKFASELIERGALVDLHSACALNDLDSIKRILSEDPAAIDRQFDAYFPIQFSLRDPATLRLLLERGDRVDRPLRKLAWFDWEDQAADRGLSDWRLIHMVALGRGTEPHLEIADVLREYGADLEVAALPFGEQPMHLAAIYSRTDLIRWFVTNGVAVDTITVARSQNASNTDLFESTPFIPFDGHCQTPLMLALGEGQTEAVNALLQLGANVNAKDSAGFTPLHFAAGSFWGENPGNVENLIQHGASLEAKDDQGRRPIDLAREKGYQANVAVLLRD